MKAHGTECKIHGKGSKILPAALFLGTGYPDESQPHIPVMSRVNLPPGDPKGIAIPNGILANSAPNHSLANSAPNDKHFENGEEISS